ncbi:hypothetical protein Nepgr_033722 [Nepenthes gracilis]|uniref:Uncharacterized protein n=1 Tax=Nepenthes gracilis TaxID=150966 RepID=A0AAD3TL46_NEPGR|nr:hypothetical protein Nepgr_033722 [Nepenthes gracilis]
MVDLEQFLNARRCKTDKLKRASKPALCTLITGISRHTICGKGIHTQFKASAFQKRRSFASCRGYFEKREIGENHLLQTVHTSCIRQTLLPALTNQAAPSFVAALPSLSSPISEVVGLECPSNRRPFPVEAISKSSALPADERVQSDFIVTVETPILPLSILPISAGPLLQNHDSTGLLVTPQNMSGCPPKSVTLSLALIKPPAVSILLGFVVW